MMKDERSHLSVKAQCSRLLDRLKKGPCTTIELRHEL